MNLSRLSKVIAWQTDRYTCRQTRPKLYTTPLRGWSILVNAHQSPKYSFLSIIILINTIIIIIIKCIEYQTRLSVCPSVCEWHVYAFSLAVVRAVVICWWLGLFLIIKLVVRSLAKCEGNRPSVVATAAPCRIHSSDLATRHRGNASHEFHYRKYSNKSPALNTSRTSNVSNGRRIWPVADDEIDVKVSVDDLGDVGRVDRRMKRNVLWADNKRSQQCHKHNMTFRSIELFIKRLSRYLK